MFEKKYVTRWLVYNFCGMKLKLKTKPVHIDTVNLVLDDNYGIGNRIFAIVNAIKYYTPKNLNFYWNKNGWVSQSFKDLFDCNFECSVSEFNEIPKNWTNSKTERTIYLPQASIITPDWVERTLSNGNITPEIRKIYREVFCKIKPSKQAEGRIQSISLPESFIALQVRNAADWDKYGRNENLDIFLDEINKYPPETVFYISAMNKETSDYIKNNCKYKILELPDKNYKSMYDAVADLYIMYRAKEGIYSFGSTFGELAWWLAEEEQKYSIAGSDKNWKWIKNN